MFAVTPTPLALIGRNKFGRFTNDETADRFARFMPPLLTDEERIAGMANALRQWCVTVEHERARRVVYDGLGIPADEAERLDAPALRRLQAILEKEKA